MTKSSTAQGLNVDGKEVSVFETRQLGVSNDESIVAKAMRMSINQVREDVEVEA